MNFKFYTNKASVLLSLKKYFLLFLIAALPASYSYSQAATALNFDGSNDFVSVPVNPVLNISNFITIEAWIKPSKTSGVQDVICKSSSTKNNGYIFPRTPNGWISLEFLINFNGSGWKSLRIPYGQNKVNQWHHVAATYDGFKMRVYLDGVLGGEYSFVGTVTVNNNPLTLGGHPGFPNEYYGGDLDEARIWNRALSQCEISNNMNCEINPSFQNGLAAYYRFNNGLLNLPNPGITTATDLSGNNVDGTLQNFGLLGLLSNWSAGNTSATSCPLFTPPVVSASVLQNIIPVGGTINLMASGGTAYSWIGPDGFNSTQQNPVLTSVPASASGTYTVAITSGTCVVSESVVVTVAPLASGLDFDGIDDQIIIPNSPTFNTQQLTIETWIYPTGGSTIIQNVFSKSTRTVNNGFKFPKTNDQWRNVTFELYLNNEWKVLTVPFPGNALNAWNHLAATYDGYFMRIYLNGALAGTLDAYGEIIVNGNDVSFGNQEGRAEYFKGKIDEFRFWTRALSQCEIVNNMQTCELDGTNGGLAQQIGLGAYYRCNQGMVNVVNNSPGNILVDSSGNGNNGLLESFTLNGSTSNWTTGKVNGLCAYFPPPLLAVTANGSTFQSGTTLNLSAENGNGTYMWDGPNAFTSVDQNPTITNLQPSATGTYTVTVPFIDCVVTASKRITVSDMPQIVADGPTTICPSTFVTLSTPVAGTQYTWYKNGVLISGATLNNYAAAQSGAYTVKVTNGSEVFVSAPITVTVIVDNLAPVPVVAVLPVINITAPATITTFPTAIDNCKGLMNGVPDISLSFPKKGHVWITWTYNDLNGNITQQMQEVVIAREIDITPPVLTVPANVTVSPIVTICGTPVNFTATATDNLDEPVTITYSHTPGSVFPVGTTTVTVTGTDSSNNVANATFTITVLPTVVAPITGNTTLCPGATSLLATLSTATGGIWSSSNDNVVTVNASGLITAQSAGTATITFTNNCGASATATVTVNAVPSAPVVSVTDNCGNSVLSTNATGSLVWSTGETGSSITVTSAGSYSITQTVNGCTSAAGSGSASPITSPAKPVVTVSNNCSNSVLSTNAGGSLLWSTGETSSSITVTNGGLYSVTQTVNGCTSEAVFATAAPKAIPSAPVVTVVDNCGTSALSASSAGSLLWSTGETTATINVTAGTYTVVQTVNGCSSVAGTGIASPKAIPSAPSVTVTDNCGNSVLSASASGSLVWSTGETSTSITVTTGGSYSVTQTLNGCTSAAGSGSASPIAAPAKPVVTVSNNCGNSILSTNASGSLLWSTGETSSSITVTTGGSYSVTQTVNGCTSEAGFATAAPKAIPSAPVVTVVDDCGTSALSASSAGSLLWSTGETTATINVTAGTYTVVQTVNGCSSVAGTGIASPKAIPSTPSVTVADNCGNSVLSASASGSLVWSTGETSSSITVTTGGSYSVTQTVNGCSSVAGLATASPIAIPAQPAVTVSNNCGNSALSTNAAGSLVWSTGETSSSITVTTGGSYSVIQTVNGCSSVAGSGIASPKAIPSAPVVTVADNCGNSVLSTNATGSLVWSTGETSSTITVTNVGLYSVTQTVNGCTSAAGSVSASPMAVPAKPVVTVSNNCGNSVLSTNASGSLVWSTGETSSSITVTTGGLYSVTQTVNGCSSVAGLATASPIAIPAQPAVTVSNNCGNSALSTNAAGSLVWSTGETSSSITVTTGGSYSVIQTVNGCSSVAGSGIASPKAIPSAPVVTVADNCGNSVLSTNATGSLVWSTGETSSTITVTNVGSYSVTQTVNGCTSAAGSVSASPIAVPAKPVVTVSNNCGNSVLSTNASGSLVWSTGETSSSITLTTGGSYSVTQTVNGCTSAASLSTASPKTIPATPVITVVNNCGSSVLSTNATGLLSWSTGANTSFITVNNSDNYTVTVSNGACASTSAVAAVTVNNIPTVAPITGTTTLTVGGSSQLASVTANGVWSSNSAVASVNVSTGMVTGISVGTANIFYTVTTDAGCSTTVSANITVNPNCVIPTLSAVANISANILSGCTAAVTYTTTVSGLPAPVVTYTFSGATSSTGSGTGSGSVFNKGITYVSISASNSCGIAGINFTVIVNDITKPVITCPGNVSVSCGSSVSPSSIGTATATDNCGGTTVTYSDNTVGNIVTRTWVATDASGNAATCNQIITLTTAFVPSVTSVPTNNTFTGGIITNLYLGYGAQSTSLQVGTLPASGAPYTYAWSGSSVNRLSSTSNASPVFTPVIAGYYTFGVTVTNKFGCSGITYISICVTDIRVPGSNGKKVYVCHAPPGNPANWHTLSISVNAVPSHLGNHTGDRLGSCDQAPCGSVVNSVTEATMTTNSTKESTEVVNKTIEEELKVTVMPNPSTTYFTLKFESRIEAPLTLRVMDGSGRVVDARSKLGANSTMQIGHNYSSGTYYAEIIQGSKRKVIQLIKLRG